MLCSLKTSFDTNGKQIRLLGKEHMRRRSGTKAPRNRLLMRKLNQEEVRDLESKSFGPDFIAYAIESEPQTFKEAMSTPEVQM